MSTTYTTYYELGMQEDKTDKFDMTVITTDMNKIDTTLHDLQLQINALSLRIKDIEDSL